VRRLRASPPPVHSRKRGYEWNHRAPRVNPGGAYYISEREIYMFSSPAASSQSEAAERERERGRESGERTIDISGCGTEGGQEVSGHRAD